MSFVMRLTAVRFSVQSMMIAVGGVALVFAYLATYEARLGCGHTNAILVFRVVDDRDGRPIPGAKIDLITETTGPPYASATTGPNGLVEMSCDVGSTSYKRPFLSSYRHLSPYYGLSIEADGCEKVDDVVRGWKYVGPGTPVSPTVMIRLKQSAKPRSSR